jgi:hypothetical protein
MKASTLLPSVLFVIIVILTGTLIHEKVKERHNWKGQLQFEIAVFVQLHQNLDQGKVDAARKRLGALVTVQSDYYEKTYGHETDTNFAPMLAQAKIIQEQFEMSK